jgi:predicted nucleic acid-binding protein
MKFWDSLAIIPLCLKEPASEVVKDLAKKDEDLVVWWATRVECISAMARRRREGVLPIHAERQAKAALTALAKEWSEILPTEPVRHRAERLLMVHSLRAADALQLAAALLWTEEATAGAEFVCLDQNLREAALKEGFTVIPQI